MKRVLYNRWLASAFVAVMAFAAGANMPPVSGCVSACAQSAQSEALINAAAAALTFDVMLWLFVAAAGGVLKMFVLPAAVFFKMFFCGVGCRAIAADGLGILGAAAIALSAVSAAAVCLCLLLGGEERYGTPLRRAAIFIAGVALEGVALPALLIAAGI